MLIPQKSIVFYIKQQRNIFHIVIFCLQRFIFTRALKSVLSTITSIDKFFLITSISQPPRFTGKFRREFKNALEKCHCLRNPRGLGGRVGGYDDRSMYHTATRMNASPSSRSNYHLTSVRNISIKVDELFFLLCFLFHSFPLRLFFDVRHYTKLCTLAVLVAKNGCLMFGF